MPRNGSGTYSLPVGNPVVTGTTISSTWANNTLTDIANALTGSLTADGQTTASGNLNMGTNRIINVGDPQNAQDVATKYYVDQLIAGLGTMAYQDANNVDITGGDIASVNIDLHSMTNEMYLPVGPTSLRTNTPINGLIRYNTDGGGFYEGYEAGIWKKFVTVNENQYSINYLAVGGGAGGTFGGGGGGSAVISVLQAIPSTTFTITVGAGGAQGAAGNNSSIAGIVTANGGAIGSGVNGGASGNGYPGGLGGQGGVSDAGGGGGGAGSSGSSNSAAYGGSGGAGAESIITGSSVFYGGGGGGTGGNTGGNSGGAGGLGGGGAGGYYVAGATPPTYPGVSGSVNTGGGGGGTYGAGAPAGSGGSGIVILSMAAASYTGTITGSPTVINTGTTVILKYTSSGSYTA